MNCTFPKADWLATQTQKRVHLQKGQTLTTKVKSQKPICQQTLQTFDNIWLVPATSTSILKFKHTECKMCSFDFAILRSSLWLDDYKKKRRQKAGWINCYQESTIKILHHMLTGLIIEFKNLNENNKSKHWIVNMCAFFI